mgnify:FL=1
MERNGVRYCDKCFLLIALAEKYVAIKIYGTNPPQYRHLHNRDRGDCYGKEVRSAVERDRLSNLQDSQTAHFA